ncbi:hypothetical protein [Mycobacterium bohemicum]|uniref:hypothetical protein n=1 Tax=Mycobacterium bohemicum TaxID=56425 RepID=UPI001112474E|nr:hypothetical protein [Mycobacterium bohemicum]
MTTTPIVPTIAKIANWMRTKRVSIYEPPSVGWLVVGVAPGTGAPWSAGAAGAPIAEQYRRGAGVRQHGAPG